MLPVGSSDIGSDVGPPSSVGEDRANDVGEGKKVNHARYHALALNRLMAPGGRRYGVRYYGAPTAKVYFVAILVFADGTLM